MVAVPAEQVFSDVVQLEQELGFAGPSAAEMELRSLS